MINKLNFKISIVKAVIVLIPSYSAAFITDKMIYVVPTLVAASFFAASINSTSELSSRRVDEDAENETDIQDIGG